MSENEKKNYRHAKVKTTQEDESNTARRTSNKKEKGKRKFKPIYIIPIVFVICCIGFAYYVLSSLNTKGPVYGERCSTGLTLDPAKMETAQNEIAAMDGISSITLSSDCLIIKMNFKFNEDVSLEDAKNKVIEATHVFDNAMGYPKSSESDAYSKLLSVDGDRRQYDLEIVMYSNQDGFPAYGTKQYRNNDITFTDSNAKDQALADSIVGGGAEESE